MLICKTVNELKSALGAARMELVGVDTVGFVPTMGALHKGHLSLVQKARAENLLVVASVFVNPIQFNNPLDLEKYPRTLEADCALLEKAGCDIVFAPSESEMYPGGKDVAFARGWWYGTTNFNADGSKTAASSSSSCTSAKRGTGLDKESRINSGEAADFGMLDKVMEGAFRPGHFNGVAVVVRRLFELIKPSVAYFGRKDFQQSVIIKHLVAILQIPVRIEVCPIVREFDGLAMSSRNTLLSHESRIVAPQLYRIMSEIVCIGGSVEYVRARIIAELEDYFKVDYFEIVDSETLQSVPAFWLVSAANDISAEQTERALPNIATDNATATPCNTCGKSTAIACAAVTIGGIRLIDNITVSLFLGANTVKCVGSCK